MGRARTRRAQLQRPRLRSVAPAARCTSTSSASSGAAAVLVGSTCAERALEDVARQRRSRPARGGSPRADARRRRSCPLEPVEQLLGLLEAALADAQVGQPDERTLAQARAVAEPPQPHGFGERRVGLGPATGRGEHAAVVGAAERRDEPAGSGAVRWPRRPGSTDRPGRRRARARRRRTAGRRSPRGRRKSSTSPPATAASASSSSTIPSSMRSSCTRLAPR